MAEGGMDFHIPEYDRDDYDNTDELPLAPNEPVGDILNTSQTLLLNNRRRDLLMHFMKQSLKSIISGLQNVITNSLKYQKMGKHCPGLLEIKKSI